MVIYIVRYNPIINYCNWPINWNINLQILSICSLIDLFKLLDFDVLMWIHILVWAWLFLNNSCRFNKRFHFVSLYSDNYTCVHGWRHIKHFFTPRLNFFKLVVCLISRSEWLNNFISTLLRFLYTMSLYVYHKLDDDCS